MSVFLKHDEVTEPGTMLSDNLKYGVLTDRGILFRM